MPPFFLIYNKLVDKLLMPQHILLEIMHPKAKNLISKLCGNILIIFDAVVIFLS